jgi:hypothetical protein
MSTTPITAPTCPTCPSFVNFKKSRIHIEAGTAIIGPNLPNPATCAVAQVKQVTVVFPKMFSCPPSVTANTLQDAKFPTAKDTFAVSILSITPDSFTVNVRRVDTNDSSTLILPSSSSWLQNLALSWIAVGPRPVG